MKLIVPALLLICLISACKQPTTEEKIKEAVIKFETKDIKDLEEIKVDSLTYDLQKASAFYKRWFDFYTKSANDIFDLVKMYPLAKDAKSNMNDAAVDIDKATFVEELMAKDTVTKIYKVDYSLAIKTGTYSHASRAEHYLHEKDLTLFYVNVDSLYKAAGRKVKMYYDENGNSIP